jgi:transposase InsO family protein
MKCIVGTASIYHTRFPNQWTLERMFSFEMSREARMRLRWMDFYHKHQNARKTCRHFGISPTTFYKWLARFCERGLRGLESLSRAPNKKRESTIPWQVVSLIVSIRKGNPAWSKHKIAVILARDHGIIVSPSTVGRILRRKGLYDMRRSKKRKRAAKRRIKRERAEYWMRDAFPGSLVQIDTKHLQGGGNRYYQFTAVDCFTRISYMRAFKSGSSGNAKIFLGRLLEYLPFPVMAVQTDNGSEYMKYFDEALSEYGITHYFSHPNCPKENARVERKIQTSVQELWAFEKAYDQDQFNEILGQWNDKYNNYRPHQALGYQTPNEFMKKWYDSQKSRGKVSTMY